MPRFDNREVSFDVPEGWQDRTVISFEAPRGGGVQPPSNVTLTKQPVASDKTLMGLVTQQIADLSMAFPKFELVRQRDTTVGTAPAIEILFHWAHPQGALTQQVTMFVNEGHVWSLTATTARGQIERDAAHFERMLRTLKFAPPGPLPESRRT